MRRTAALVLLATILGCCACGGSSSHTTETTATAARHVDPTTQLEHAVRTALAANHRLSGYVLWHNVVPGWATQSTRASALAALRASASDRRSQGIRIRPLTDHVDVLDVQISPSYASATATVRDTGVVVPYRGGRRLGRTIRLDERARVELHRIGDALRFVVWRVSAVQ